MKITTLSFIIPAFNEKDYIENTLKQLHKYAPKQQYEVIVVDNGSTDATSKIATNMGDKVISCTEGTIAKVRNTGVSASKGEILIFLDADVELTQEWQDNIQTTIASIEKNPLQITGSRCLPQNNTNSLNIHWFNLLVANNSTTYINSGHLITSRFLFNSISGFDEKLRTAEDHDFCTRAKQAGALISPTPLLKVIHDGYPTTYTQFIKRERWHGREDFKTLGSIVKSKIALIICFHAFIFLLSIMISYYNGIIFGCAMYLFIMSILSVALTRYKFHRAPIKSLIKTSLIHYLYIIGRTGSLIDRLTCQYSNKFR